MIKNLIKIKFKITIVGVARNLFLKFTPYSKKLIFKFIGGFARQESDNSVFLVARVPLELQISGQLVAEAHFFKLLECLKLGVFFGFLIFFWFYCWGLNWHLGQKIILSRKQENHSDCLQLL